MSGSEKVGDSIQKSPTHHPLGNITQYPLMGSLVVWVNPTMMIGDLNAVIAPKITHMIFFVLFGT
jgi:hypothetical protein